MNDPWLNNNRFANSSLLSQSNPDKYKAWLADPDKYKAWSADPDKYKAWLANLEYPIYDNNIVPFKGVEPFNPIKTELGRGTLYDQPEEEEEEKEEEKINPEVGNGGPDPDDNGRFGERGFHYAYEDWGPLSKGLGMTNPKTGFFEGLKSAVNNAKIGLTGLNIFGHPMDDPGWASVMAANGFKKEDLAQYYSMPGQKMPSSFTDALKQHTSLSEKALTTVHGIIGSPSSGFSQFTSVDPTAIDKTTGAFHGYSFDRAGYMAQLVSNPATAAYAAHVTSNNNVNATKTMLGGMLLGTPEFKGTVFSSSVSFNLEPGLAYDFTEAMLNADLTMNQIANAHSAVSVLDSMTPTQRMQYMSALTTDPDFAANEANKVGKAATALENARKGLGSDHDLSAADADIAGRSASTATKEALGISKDETFGSAIERGAISFEDFAQEYDKAKHGTTPAAPSPSTPNEAVEPSQAGPGEGGSDSDPGEGFSDAPGGNMEGGYR